MQHRGPAADLRTWRHGGVLSSGGLEARCRCSDMEAYGYGRALKMWGHGGMEILRNAVGGGI